MDDTLFLGHFDGAEINGLCGEGMVLKVKRDHFIHLRMGVGNGTNTKVELFSLWVLLWFAQKRGIFSMQIVGNSKVIIDWATWNSNLQVILIEQWDDRVKYLINSFSQISFTHIYKKHNYEADGLSKNAIGNMDGNILLKNLWRIK